jgi:hypothetical protein
MKSAEELKNSSSFLADAETPKSPPHVDSRFSAPCVFCSLEVEPGGNGVQLASTRRQLKEARRARTLGIALHAMRTRRSRARAQH